MDATIQRAELRIPDFLDEQIDRDIDESEASDESDQSTENGEYSEANEASYRLMFKPVSREEFYQSVDRGLEQSRRGQARDAFESLEEITAELEAGYDTMQAVRKAHGRKAIAAS